MDASRVGLCTADEHARQGWGLSKGVTAAQLEPAVDKHAGSL